MERRGQERYRVWFPMTVRTPEGEEGTAITYDVSATGLLMACPGELAVGAVIHLSFRVGADDPPREIAARVLRVEPRPDEEGPWRFRMAVEFAEAQPDLEGVLAARAEDGG